MSARYAGIDLSVKCGSKSGGNGGGKGVRNFGHFGERAGDKPFSNRG